MWDAILYVLKNGNKSKMHKDENYVSEALDKLEYFRRFCNGDNFFDFLFA